MIITSCNYCRVTPLTKGCIKGKFLDSLCCDNSTLYAAALYFLPVSKTGVDHWEKLTSCHFLQEEGRKQDRGRGEGWFPGQKPLLHHNNTGDTRSIILSKSYICLTLVPFPHSYGGKYKTLEFESGAAKEGKEAFQNLFPLSFYSRIYVRKPTFLSRWVLSAIARGKVTSVLRDFTSFFASCSKMFLSES